MWFVGSFVLCAVASFNCWRAWRWREVPVKYRGAEPLIPAQAAAVVFFAAAPTMTAIDAILGHPASGSPHAVIAGAVGLAIALAGIALGLSLHYFGRPQRLIAPVARSVARWAPRRG